MADRCVSYEFALVLLGRFRYDLLTILRQDPHMIIGYARTSTAEQDAGLEAQVRDLRDAGCTKIFAEQVSSLLTRAQLQAALDFCREGDVFVITKPDRMARSTSDLL